MSYIYKFTVAIVLTPLIYLVEGRIERYVGHGVAEQMKKAAMGMEEESAGTLPAAG